MYPLPKNKRLNRRSYLLNILAGVGIIISMAIIMALPTGALTEDSSGMAGAIGTSMLVTGIGLSWLLIALCTTYRLHDQNLSGWVGLFALAPFAGFIVVIMIIFAPGKIEGNKWGEKSNKIDWIIEA